MPTKKATPPAATEPAKKPKKRLTDAARLKRMAADTKWLQKKVATAAKKKK